MRRICSDCKEEYDDVDATTICPHEPLRSPEMKTQWELGSRLLGNRVRFNHWPPGSGVNCTTLYFDGTVGLEGRSGQFAPHLFTIDGELEALPVIGMVN
jgi:hypothetical protein